MNKVWMWVALFAGVFVVAGCGPKIADNAGSQKKGEEVARAEPKDEGGHGWWCEEHGVKEDECSICQKEVFKKLKPNEICPQHPDRAKAQCFICNAELWEKSKATYRAKYGKEPPEPKENMPEKK
jgi:hypothetical protein